jgi:putative DNA primase/helicase
MNPLVEEKDTDLGNARRLAAIHGGTIRFVAGWGWLIWDGKRWCRRDTDGSSNVQVLRLAKDTIRQLYKQARDLGDSPRHESLLKHAKNSERVERLNAMVKLAESEAAVRATTEQFDRDPYLLNCVNGTLDLRTGDLQPHRPTDYLTMLAPVKFEAEAKSLEWIDFIGQIFRKDEKLIDFVQKSIGYSATGDTREEIILIAHGRGQTGKSTFLEAIRATLGEYAATTPFSTFLRRGNDSSPRNDIARLMGKRVVVASEVPPGQYFDEGLIKSLTGGDTVAARFLRKEFFEFRPQFTPWLAANHLPRLRGDDDAMWRRLRIVPFVVRIPDEECDKGLKGRLANPAATGPAILAWIAEGTRKWLEEGLSAPETVLTATRAYQDDSDTFGQFIEDCCELNPNGYALSAALYALYETWCDKNAVRYPLGNRGISEQLRALACWPEKCMGARSWRGIRITSDVPIAARTAARTDGHNGH